MQQAAGGAWQHSLRPREDGQAAFDKAFREGAEEMIPPTKVMKDVTVAIVRAPGGVAIGFSGP